MTLQHGNRIRRTAGEHVIRDVGAAEAGEVAAREPTLEEIRRRAYEIYRRRNGAPGNLKLDWLQAELELGHAARRP
jgi:hypothetical protein